MGVLVGVVGVGIAAATYWLMRKTNHQIREHSFSCQKCTNLFNDFLTVFLICYKLPEIITLKFSKAILEPDTEMGSLDSLLPTAHSHSEIGSSDTPIIEPIQQYASNEHEARFLRMIGVVFDYSRHLRN